LFILQNNIYLVNQTGQPIFITLRILSKIESLYLRNPFNYGAVSLKFYTKTYS